MGTVSDFGRTKKIAMPIRKTLKMISKFLVHRAGGQDAGDGARNRSRGEDQTGLIIDALLAGIGPGKPEMDVNKTTANEIAVRVC